MARSGGRGGVRHRLRPAGGILAGVLLAALPQALPVSAVPATPVSTVSPLVQGQPTLLEAELEAWTEPDGSVRAVIEYELRPGASRLIPFLYVAFAPTSLKEIQAFVGGQPVDVERHVSGPRIEGRIILPTGGSKSTTVSLRLETRVGNGFRDAAAGHELLLPLPVVTWPPASAAGEVFTAGVNLPMGLRVYRSFPAAQEESATRFSLPVVPSVIRLQAAAGSPPFLTLERTVDGVAVALLLSFAAIGWRQFRRAMAEVGDG